tara:strand:- start:420 stop:926 length:507 start_codon:yes stop_codon:yes gene_type:complete
MSNLRHLAESSASSVASMSITDCFSSDYDIYKVVLNEIEFSDGDMFFRFINASGSIISSSNYDDAVYLMRSYGAFADNNNEGATSLGSIGYDNVQKGGATVIWVFNPTSSSSYTYALWQNTGESSSGPPIRKGIGVLKLANSITGINFVGGATITNVNARVYGLRVDS